MNTRRGGVHSTGNECTVVPSASSYDSKPDNYPINAKICCLVKEYPFMYDRSHPQYLKKDAVDKAWIKIAKEMNDSIPSCKERWRNIRTSFARSINTTKVPASANRTKPYYLHEELKFLAHHITPGVPVPRRAQASLSSMGEESEEVKVSMSEESFDSFAALTQRSYENENTQDAIASNDETTQSTSALRVPIEKREQSSTPPLLPPLLAHHNNESLNNNMALLANAAEVAPMMVQPVCPCPPKKRQRLLNYGDTEDEHNSALEPEVKLFTNNILNSQLNESSKSEDIDFDDSFLQGLRPEMKAMNFHQRLYFKRRVYDVLGEIFPQANVNSTNIPNIQQHIPTETGATQQFGAINGLPIGQPIYDANLLYRLNALLQQTTQVTPATTESPPNTAMVTIPKSSIAQPKAQSPRQSKPSRVSSVRSRYLNKSLRTIPASKVKEEPMDKPFK